jgi:hypothetical protein
VEWNYSSSIIPVSRSAGGGGVEVLPSRRGNSVVGCCSDDGNYTKRVVDILWDVFCCPGEAEQILISVRIAHVRRDSKQERGEAPRKLTERCRSRLVLRKVLVSKLRGGTGYSEIFSSCTHSSTHTHIHMLE